MKVHERSRGSLERRILTAMVTSKLTLGRIASNWSRQGLFSSPYANTIGRWCVEYYRKYDDAPNEMIEILYYKWAKKVDENTAELVESFLKNISGEYEQLGRQINTEYILDQATEHFTRVKVENLNKELEATLINGTTLEALEKIASFGKVSIANSKLGVDPFTDQQTVQSVFDRREDLTLVKYPGALGRFFLHALERDRFIAIEAPEKTGKSFVAQDIAYRGLLQRRKVGYFAIGDLTEKQQLERLYVRLTLCPLRSPTGKWPMKIKIPVKLDPPNRKKDSWIAKVKFEEQTFKEPLDLSVSWKECERLMNRDVRSKQSYFKLSCHSNDGIDIDGIRDIIKVWESQDFLPDIIVIDYADLLAAPEGYKKRDERSVIDITWKRMRAISQDYHNLVITPTQASKAAYTKKLLTRSEVSNDKRKNAHVDGKFDINMTDEEKELGLCRLNWTEKREGFFSAKRVVYCAGSLALASPLMLSCLEKS